MKAISEGLSAEKIDALLRKWLRLLPHPFTPANRKAGYLYDVSILQAEFSLTQVLDQLDAGRVDLVISDDPRDQAQLQRLPRAEDRRGQVQLASARAAEEPRHESRCRRSRPRARPCRTPS